MTHLMRRALRRLSALPEPEQDRVARHVLSLPEMAAETPHVSLGAVARAAASAGLPADALDRRLDALRDEWDA